MIHTNLPQNCVVFLLLCKLTRSAIYGSQKFDSHKWPACVDHYILLLKHLSNHMHFITNGYKRFSKTNSTDPRQRVPLKTLHEVVCSANLGVFLLSFNQSIKRNLYSA